jgi:hypothetical protein
MPKKQKKAKRSVRKSRFGGTDTTSSTSSTKRNIIILLVMGLLGAGGYIYKLSKKEREEKINYIKDKLKNSQYYEAYPQIVKTLLGSPGT